MMKKLTYHHGRLLLLLVAAVLLAACSDDANTPEEDTDILQLKTITQGMTEVSSLDTRAIPTGYAEYIGSSTIGVYLTTEDATFAPPIRTFYYADNQWKSLVSVKNSTTYYIYGYMPVENQVICTISTLADDKDYSKGAKLTFSQMPPMMTEDLCVITGVQDITGEPPNPNSEVNLEIGKFQYTGKASGNNYVNLMLDHLYASVQFKMQVDATYNQLRTIKLKKVKLKSTLTNLYTCQGEVTLEKDNACTISWTQTGNLANEKSVTLFTSESEEGEALKPAESKDPIVIDGYFAPLLTIANSLVLECTYDVYDKQGNMTRKDCVAENKLSNSNLTLSVGTGMRTVLTLTVKPTYLYVLSDPDLDNPTIQTE